MLYGYLDASALAKRYVIEPGTTVVNHLFHRMTQDRMIIQAVRLAEVASILVRKRNAGRLTAAQFIHILSDCRDEIGIASPVRIIGVTDDLADRSIDFIDRYSVNSTDAIILRSALDIAAPLQAAGDDLLLVSCNQRLLKAAKAEGIITFDPEAQSTADLDALLGP